jgi:hypothetical protein
LPLSIWEEESGRAEKKKVEERKKSRDRAEKQRRVKIGEQHHREERTQGRRKRGQEVGYRFSADITPYTCGRLRH